MNEKIDSFENYAQLVIDKFLTELIVDTCQEAYFVIYGVLNEISHTILTHFLNIEDALLDKVANLLKLRILSENIQLPHRNNEEEYLSNTFNKIFTL